MSPRLAHAVVALTLAVPASGQDATRLESILVENRPAEDLLDVVRSLLDDDGSVAAAGNRLLVRAAPARLAEVRRLVAELDVAPRSLWITVKQASDAAAATGSGGVSVEARRGPGAERRTSRTVVSGAFAESHSGTDTSQRLQVLEGRPAWIRVGRAVPVAGAGYIEADTGFSVVARLAGDLVTLEVRAGQAAAGESGTVDRHELTTSVSGRLGEWLALGEALREAASRSSSVLSTETSRLSQARSIQLKVERAP